MPHPLESSYNWRTPSTLASVGLVISLGFVTSSRMNGWLPVAFVFTFLWAVLMVVIWVRTRAYLMVDGPQATVRRFRRFVVIDGRSVTSVRELMTPNGLSYSLTVTTPDGSRRRRVVPTALLRKGHSTLFQWLLTYAPQAELDRGAQKTLEQLRIKGLLS